MAKSKRVKVSKMKPNASNRTKNQKRIAKNTVILKSFNSK